jgi:hypothetical protein
LWPLKKQTPQFMLWPVLLFGLQKH